MTGAHGRGSDELPIFDVIEPAPAGAQRIGARSGGGRLGPGRGAGAAAAVLATLVVGIAVGSLSLKPDPSGAPTPARPPRNSPAVPCGTLQPTADIGVRLFAGSQISIPGSVGVRSTPAEVHASAADPIQIRIDGDTCAVGWNIELTNVEGGGITPVSRFSDPADDPAYAAQNRWGIASAFGQQIVILTASLHFRDGLDVVRTWQIMLEPFVVPSLYLVGHDGIRFEASFGCGLFLDLRDGYQSSEECVSIGYHPGPDALYVAPYDVIHLDLPGWQLTSWSANCGTVTSGDTEQFEAPGGCGLGGGSSDDGGPLEDPPAFVLPAGDTVISIGIGAIDDALNQFNVIYYAHVIAR